MDVIPCLVSTNRGQLIKRAYTAAGMNRNQFAKAIGTNYSNVWRWEKGEAEPSLESIEKAAKATGTPIDKLLSEEPETVVVDEARTYPEFEIWLKTMAPDDLTDAERATLSSWRFQGAHPGPTFYATSLATWRAGVTAADALRATEHTEEIRRNRRDRMNRDK